MTIEEARKTIHDFWMERDEKQFAREVLAGSWDHRSDVQAAVKGLFDPNVMDDIIARSRGVKKRA